MMPTCGNCHKHHPTVQEVKDCYGGGMGKPAAFAEPATEKQVAFLNGLLAVKDTTTLSVPMCQRLAKFQRGEPLSKREISELLSAFGSLPDQSSHYKPTLPPGKYAVENAQGVVEFWQVDRPAIGKWAGRTFINMLLGSPGEWRTVRAPRVSSTEAMQKITADPIAAAQLFGIKTKTCGRCSSPLSNARSRAAGYGEHCAGLVGWPYPTRDEALRILDERGETDQEESE